MKKAGLNQEKKRRGRLEKRKIHDMTRGGALPWTSEKQLGGGKKIKMFNALTLARL